MVEGTIFVTCETHRILKDARKDVIKNASSALNGSISAFMVDKKKSSTAVDVVINFDTESKDRVMEAKDKILNMDGVSSVKYWITR